MQKYRATFSDYDEMSAFVRAWDVHFVPLKAVTGEPAAGSLVQAFGDSFQYSFSSFASPQSMSGAVPKALVTFNVMEPTAHRYWVRGHDVGPDMAWVFPADSELRSLSPIGFQVHTLSVSDERIEQVAHTLALPVPPRSRRPEVFRLQKDVLAPVLKCLRTLRDGTDIPATGVADACLRLLVSAWFEKKEGQLHYLRTLPTSSRALGWSLALIDHEDVGKVPLTSLLAAANVSERTLQYAFRDRFGLTPAAFMKARNLAKVKVALREADPDTVKVGDIAAKHGFWHVGQFAADYRRLFGERPSETLQKAK